MTATLTWSVKKMSCVQKPNPNYVVNVRWLITGTDGINTTTLEDSVNFPTEQNENFIAFENLTEDIVIGWVKQNIEPDMISYHEQSVILTLQAMQKPPEIPVVVTFPWAKT